MLVSLPTWSQTKTTSKSGFDKVYKVVDKLGNPINRLSNKIGSEAFWPTTLDRESDKAARILRSFCKDGFYVDEPKDHIPSGEAPKGKARVVKKIPSEVIQKAKGLAIFTTMRTGLWVSGAGGSGILVARTATGEWSPPSGIVLHTAGLGFLVGVDIYDCVVVINTEKALQAFTKIRCTVGGEISAVAGPVGIGGVLETEIHKRQAPLWTYLKSRGFYAGVQVDGTVIVERSDENERFYGQRIGVADILAGKVRHAPYEIRTLMATIKAAQGDTDVDEAALPASEPTPGDMELEKGDTFGLPAEDDPDPFGVLALEKEGFEIKEAGTNHRPSAEAFEYKPSPSSPIFNTFNRHSLDGSYRRNSKRSSQQSVASIDRGTQTDFSGIILVEDMQRDHSPIKKTTENLALEPNGEEPRRDSWNKVDQSKGVSEGNEGATVPVISRARLVTIPKRIPPALPPRNPYRNQPPPILMNTEPYGSPTEMDSHGLGLDLGEISPRRNHFDHENNVPPESPTKEDIDQKIDNLYLSLNKDTSNSVRDPDRLSPRKDGFDEISMSGSDYSREAPATVPAHEYQVEPANPHGPPNAMNNLSNHTITTTTTSSELKASPPPTPFPYPPIDPQTPTSFPPRSRSRSRSRSESESESKPPYEDFIAAGTGVGVGVGGANGGGSKPDEFHSVPSTPLETSIPTHFPPVIVGGKGDVEGKGDSVSGMA